MTDSAIWRVVDTMLALLWLKFSYTAYRQQQQSEFSRKLFFAFAFAMCAIRRWFEYQGYNVAIFNPFFTTLDLLAAAVVVWSIMQWFNGRIEY
jgi:hypothetical protein